MNCVEAQALLDLHMDGELSEETRTRMERHLLHCADCAFQARALEQSRALLREAYPRAESSPAFREKMTARLQDAFADLLRPEPEPAANQRVLPLDLVRHADGA